jgi:hypothetical protein
MSQYKTQKHAEIGLVWVYSVSFSQENAKIHFLPLFLVVGREKTCPSPLFLLLLLLELASLTVHCLRRESLAHMTELGSGKGSVEREEIDGSVW